MFIIVYIFYLKKDLKEFGLKRIWNLLYSIKRNVVMIGKFLWMLWGNIGIM